MMSVSEILFFLRERRFWVPGILLVFFIAVAGFLFRGKLVQFFRSPVKISENSTNVELPTIIDGELVLPKIASAGSSVSYLKTNPSKLAVQSANLVGIFDKDQLTGLRIVGEVTNIGDLFVASANPVIRFIDTSGKVTAQKLARYSTDFRFVNIAPAEKTVYDVTVDGPPKSDRIEILFDTISSSASADLEALKIASRSFEVKTAVVNSEPVSTASAVPSAPAQTVSYYVASGKAINSYSRPVSDISIYAWVKDDKNKVFALGHTDFKNDLISPGDGVDFKIMILPFQEGQTYSSYEISAWGREYQFNF